MIPYKSEEVVRLLGYGQVEDPNGGSFRPREIAAGARVGFAR